MHHTYAVCQLRHARLAETDPLSAFPSACHNLPRLAGATWRELSHDAAEGSFLAGMRSRVLHPGQPATRLARLMSARRCGVGEW